VGIHIESFDSETLSRVAPVKAAMGLKGSRRHGKMAVEISGPIRSVVFLIVGLGEKTGSIIWGSKYLADMGVFPFVVPLRPIPGSLMEDVLPPSPEMMREIYEAVACLLKKKGLSSSRSLAGCVRCGTCSALSHFEEATDPLTCHPCQNQSGARKGL